MKFKYLVLRALAALINIHLGHGDRTHHATIADQCTREADRLQEVANGEVTAIKYEFGRREK